ncbi:MAG: dTDP-4-dehydrorhamnose reductase, partial [Acidobacteriota bacterium]
MRLLLLGARGMFGRDAVPWFQQAGYTVAGGDLPEVDITSPPSVARFLDAHPCEVVLNAAAFTDVDGAESRREEAFRVNAEGARVAAEACAARGLLLVHLSTDYVFPGDRPEGYLPGDRPGPAANAYGESKLAGEEAIRAVLPPGRFLICRTQWLYGRHGRNFVETILALARQRESLSVVDDQWGVPTWTLSLAPQISGLLRRGVRGYAHAVGGGGPVTWHRFAQEIVRLAGLSCTVKPCRTEEVPRPAPRPRHAWLRPDPSLPPPQPWNLDLARYLG